MEMRLGVKEAPKQPGPRQWRLEALWLDGVCLNGWLNMRAGVPFKENRSFPFHDERGTASRMVPDLHSHFGFIICPVSEK